MILSDRLCASLNGQSELAVYEAMTQISNLSYNTNGLKIRLAIVEKNGHVPIFQTILSNYEKLALESEDDGIYTLSCLVEQNNTKDNLQKLCKAVNSLGSLAMNSEASKLFIKDRDAQFLQVMNVIEEMLDDDGLAYNSLYLQADAAFCLGWLVKPVYDMNIPSIFRDSLIEKAIKALYKVIQTLKEVPDNINSSAVVTEEPAKNMCTFTLVFLHKYMTHFSTSNITSKRLIESVCVLIDGIFNIIEAGMHNDSKCTYYKFPQDILKLAYESLYLLTPDATRIITTTTTTTNVASNPQSSCEYRSFVVQKIHKDQLVRRLLCVSKWKPEPNHSPSHIIDGRDGFGNVQDIQTLCSFIVRHLVAYLQSKEPI